MHWELMLFYKYSKASSCGYTHCVIQTRTLPTASNSLLIPAQSPPVTRRGFSNTSPCGDVMRISQKSLTMKHNPNGACGFVGAERLLAPSQFWMPCSAALTPSRQWTMRLPVTFQESPPEMLQSCGSRKVIPGNTCRWAPPNVSQTMVWSSLETGLLPSPFQTLSLTTSTCERWLGPLRSARL